MTRDRFNETDWLIQQTIKKANTEVNELHRRIGRLVTNEVINWTLIEELKAEIARLDNIVSALDLL